MRALLVPALALTAALLSACAAQPEVRADADPNLRCTRETPTGTSISVTRCRDRETLERERQGVDQAQEALRSAPPISRQ